MTDAMTDERLAEIEARLRGATPGPWVGDGRGIDGGEWAAEEIVALETQGSAWMQYETLKISDADAALIVAAPTDLADLLAEVHRLRAELATEREQRVLWQGRYEGARVLWQGRYEGALEQLRAAYKR